MDGIAGVQTQVALDAALNDSATPFLRNSGGADMSFILDALKKSENDRQRQSAPALFEVKVAAPRRSFPLWAVGLAVLLGVNVAVSSVVRAAARLRRAARTGNRAPAAAAPQSPSRARRPGMVTVPATSTYIQATFRRPSAPGVQQPHRAGRRGAEPGAAARRRTLAVGPGTSVPPDYDARDYRPAITPEQAKPPLPRAVPAKTADAR